MEISVDLILGRMYDAIVMFNKITEKVNDIHSDTSASIYICGNFNTHPGRWLVNSDKTDEESYCHACEV